MLYNGMEVPKSFKQLSVELYQEIHPIYKKLTETTDSEVYNDCWDNILAVLTDSQLDEIQLLPFKKRTELLNKLVWLTKPIPNYGVKKYILVNGKLHKAALNAKSFNWAQYKEVKEFLKNGTYVEQLHNLLATMYMPLTITGFRHDGKGHAKRAQYFKQKKVGDVYPTVFFYSKVLQNSIKSIADYGITQSEKIIEKVLEEIQKEISGLDGDGKQQLTSLLAEISLKKTS